MKPFLLALLIFGVVACKDGIAPPPEPPRPPQFGSLLLKLEHIWGAGSSFVCNDWLVHPISGDSLRFDQLRYYLSAFELEDSNGVKVVLPPNIPLIALSGSLFLVSIADVPVGSYRKISFDLGFTAATLQQNPTATFLDPLYGMYAGPDTGYLSVKSSGLAPASPTGSFQIALGGGSAAQPMHQRLSFEFTDGLVRIRHQREASMEFDVDVSKIWSVDMPLAQWYQVTSHGQQCVRMLGNLGTGFKYRHLHD
ncbi:MAG: hypothetical protein Q8J69_02565 [Sphingobacteriaceae bacterium]|nr:hypothetical protein [Sphingobacteriaceae bacterium]